MNRFLKSLLVLIMCGSLSAQQTDYVDFLSVKADIQIDSENKGVNASVKYKFKILKEIDSVYLDARGRIEHYEIKEKNFKAPVRLLDNRLVFTDTKALVKDSIYEFRLIYFSKPQKTVYFVGDQIWTQGQGKYTSHWLPSIDDVNDKIEFDLSIDFDSRYEVMANGNLVEKMEADGATKWIYDMQNPMSSYLVAFVIGRYDKETEFSKSGVPLEYYYYPEDSLKVESTYRYTKQMFDYLEGEIGFPFPWQNYKQVPVQDFLYAGMENTGLTIFSDSYVVDATAFNDENYITVNAHELSHQWFGDLVTAASSEHHWLQEGFATYYAMLAERYILGEDHYYWQLYEYAQELIAQDSSGQSTSLLDPKSSSTTFYKKGAWALHVLREKVGNAAFRAAVTTYLEKYQFANVKTMDFITEVELASGQDLSGFVEEWLNQVSLPEDAIVKSLKRSSFIREYLDLDCRDDASSCKALLSSNISDKAKVKVISQVPGQVEGDAFENSREVRQAISQYVDRIPVSLKSHYETLLEDDSYVTIENALYHLWVNFPGERVKYLQKTKNVIGFNDNNVRLLWLALHLNTPEYQPEKKELILNEMITYSLPHQPFELRQNAFNYLRLIGGFEQKSISSLIGATKHHSWRFSNFAMDLLSELEGQPKYNEIIKSLKKS